MVLSSASELGKIIGGLVNTTNRIQEDHVPGGVDQAIVLTPIDRAKVETTVVISKKFYANNSFILDHLVYGEVDSSTLLLDGDYYWSEGLTFPITFDEVFTGGVSTVIHDIYTG